MINQTGGGFCSICGAKGVNLATCPFNPKSKNPNIKKHNKKVISKKLTRKNVKLDSKMIKLLKKRETKTNYTKQKKNKMPCKKYKKNKTPKCNDQSDCVWIPKKKDKIGICSDKIKNDIIIKKLIKPKEIIKVNEIDKKFISSDNLIKFTEFLNKIHSISGIGNYGYINLKSGPKILNFGDLHTIDPEYRNRLENDNLWKMMCDKYNMKNKEVILFNKERKNKFTEKNEYEIRRNPERSHRVKVLDLKLDKILRNNEIFISYLILYILKNFKNVHLFFEFRKSKEGLARTGRHSTPMWFLYPSIQEISSKKPQFMKDNNNFIHYNDFRTDKFVFYNFLKNFTSNTINRYNHNFIRYGKKDRTKIRKFMSAFDKLKLIKKIYTLIFFQGYKTKKTSYKFNDIKELIDVENKPLWEIIITDSNIITADLFLLKIFKSAEQFKSMTTIQIDKETIHCTRISKQLLKLKPEIQDKVAEWFYDVVLNDFEYIINLTLSVEPIDDSIDNSCLTKLLLNKYYDYSKSFVNSKLYLNRQEQISLLNNSYKRYNFYVNYIFWILFIDFYNLCRILYYTGFNNDSKDMSNNIILNYGGENLYNSREHYSNKVQLERVMDKNTGGHISIILLFFRNYLYKKSRKSNKYIKKTTPQVHYHIKNDNIEIKKYIRQDNINRLECVKIK